jgi:hypothetical protein
MFGISKMRGFPMSNCSAIIHSSGFDRPFDFASEEAATRRILWLTRREVEGIAVIQVALRMNWYILLPGTSLAV